VSPLHASSLCALILLASPAARSQVQHGDVLITKYGLTGTTSIQHYRGDGTHVLSTVGGSGDRFLGPALLPDGRLLANRRNPNGFNLFDAATGLPLDSRDTPALTQLTGDGGALSDGTVAIVEQSTGALLFALDGTHIATLADPGIFLAYSLFVDENDDVWIGDLRHPGVDEGAVWHFRRNGTLIRSIATPFSVGDLVVATDGSIWATDYRNGDVYGLDSTGAVLTSFATPLPTPQFHGIAMAIDGTLLVTSYGASEVLRYDLDGTPLGQFPLTSSNLWGFMAVVREPVGARYCAAASSSLGVAASIFASGSASASAADLRLAARPVPDGPGIFFHGSNQIQIPFGCGFLCTAGGVRRGEVGWAAGGVATYAYDGSSSQRSLAAHVAQVRGFQYWFRDPAGAGQCTSGATFNTSDAMAITVLP